MNKVSTLSQEEVQAALSGLEGWALNAEGAIARNYTFANFVAAFGFMAQVAILAEKAGHHPDWSNSYNRVTIALVTHDAGGITRKDIELAEAINAL